jgi:hypothetical protein
MRISNFLLLALDLIVATLFTTSLACQCGPRPDTGEFIPDHDATRT